MMRRTLFSAAAAVWLALVVVSAAEAQAPVPAPVPDPHAGHQMPAPAPAAQDPEGAPVPPITDADRAAAFPPDLHGHAVHDGAINYFVLFDQLEWQVSDEASGVSWDNKTWIGGDRNRLWLRTEGESSDGRLEDAEAQVFFGRAIARWWDVVVGARQDFRPGPGRTWAAVGIQGLAPQWFEVEVTAYVGESGRTAARLEAEYELLLTNRLVLQPLVELNLFGKSDPVRDIGSGLSTADVGFRLRYEVKREFAPYIGAVWQRKFFGTADHARGAGEGVGGWKLAGGLRMWF